MRNLLIIIFVTLLYPFGVKGQNDTIGIFLKNGSEIQKITPRRMTKTKVNTLAAALTMGVANTSMKTVYSGATSRNIANKDSKFYFYHPATIPMNIMQTYFMFAATYSPSDFIIAKLESKKKSRELLIGKINAYSGSTMGSNEDTGIELNVKNIKEGIYEVSFAKEPESGEYCFLFLSPGGSGGFLPIFDFKIEQ